MIQEDRFFEAWLLEYYLDCFEAVPETVSHDPPITPAQEARCKHAAAIVRQRNAAQYRALLKTKTALIRAGEVAKAVRLAEHLDRHWSAYAN